MEIKYENRTIEIGDLVSFLETYAKAVLGRMQQAEPEYADCWTACSITFDELQPEFAWGSIEDIKESDGIYIELPLTTKK